MLKEIRVDADLWGVDTRVLVDIHNLGYCEYEKRYYKENG